MPLGPIIMVSAGMIIQDILRSKRPLNFFSPIVKGNKSKILSVAVITLLFLLI